MKNWYYSLSLRERYLVTYGSIVAALILFWLLLLQPALKQQKRLSQEITDKRNSLELMKVQSAQIRQYQQLKSARNGIATAGNPQQLVESALQTWRLKPALQRMQSQGPDAVRLTLKEANADFVMRFLNDLEKRYTLHVENLSVSATKEAGKVNVRLTVKK